VLSLRCARGFFPAVRMTGLRGDRVKQANEDALFGRTGLHCGGIGQANGFPLTGHTAGRPEYSGRPAALQCIYSPASHTNGTDQIPCSLYAFGK